MQAPCGQDGSVLQIALAPAAIADRDVGQRGWTLLVAAGDGGHHMDRPTSTAEQRRFHKIVAEDMTSERLAAGQRREPGGIGEGAGPNDGVMSPVIAFRAMPPGDAMRDHRPI